ncbi:MAG: hypothetical protein AAB652_00170 [Patescibacteria group bacterium]
MRENFLKYSPELIAVLFVLFTFARFVGAAPLLNDVTDVEKLLCRIFGYVFTIFIILSLIMTLWAAFLYLTAGGEPEKIKTAGRTLMYVAVAVAVALIARGFPRIILSLFPSGNPQQLIGC